MEIFDLPVIFYFRPKYHQLGDNDSNEFSTLRIPDPIFRGVRWYAHNGYFLPRRFLGRDMTHCNENCQSGFGNQFTLASSTLHSMFRYIASHALLFVPIGFLSIYHVVGFLLAVSSALSPDW